MSERDWIKQAECVGADSEIFFHDNNATFITQARAICQTRPVRRACLTDCMRHEGGRAAVSRYGVYAGLTPRQRARLYQKLRDARRRAAV